MPCFEVYVFSSQIYMPLILPPPILITIIYSLPRLNIPMNECDRNNNKKECYLITPHPGKRTMYEQSLPPTKEVNGRQIDGDKQAN